MGTKFCVTGTVMEELPLFILIKESEEVADNCGLFLAHIPAPPPPTPTRSWQSLILRAPGATNEKWRVKLLDGSPLLVRQKSKPFPCCPRPPTPASQPSSSANLGGTHASCLFAVAVLCRNIELNVSSYHLSSL